MKFQIKVSQSFTKTSEIFDLNTIFTISQRNFKTAKTPINFHVKFHEILL